MNVSSIHREDEYPTIESRRLLETVEKLRREVTRFRDKISDQRDYKRLLKNMEAVEESLKLHLKRIDTMERALITASHHSLTDKQLVMLRWLVENYDEETVYTSLIERLSKEFGFPRSTVRWNLRGLRESSLIQAGDKENKGIPVRLTEAGRLMASYVFAEGC